MRQTQYPGSAAQLPHRIGGNLALDLANTFSHRGTPRETDHLADTDAVLAWAKDAGVVKSRLGVPIADGARLVIEVHRLRRAIDQAFSAIARGKAPPNAALTAIRDIAAHSLASATLAGAPARLKFTGAHAIIGPLAWAAFDLLRSDELDRLKQCPPHDCRWLFIDRSKNGSRRWCEMATCGDRAKKNARR